MDQNIFLGPGEEETQTYGLIDYIDPEVFVRSQFLIWYE
jgi:hypothetical protein